MIQRMREKGKENNKKEWERKTEYIILIKKKKKKKKKRERELSLISRSNHNSHLFWNYHKVEKKYMTVFLADRRFGIST